MSCFLSVHYQTTDDWGLTLGEPLNSELFADFIDSSLLKYPSKLTFNWLKWIWVCLFTAGFLNRRPAGRRKMFGLCQFQIFWHENSNAAKESNINFYQTSYLPEVVSNEVALLRTFFKYLYFTGVVLFSVTFTSQHSKAQDRTFYFTTFHKTYRYCL